MHKHMRRIISTDGWTTTTVLHYDTILCYNIMNCHTRDWNVLHQHPVPLLHINI